LNNEKFNEKKVNIQAVMKKFYHTLGKEGKKANK
jgi:hypothetical protein